MLVCLMSRTVDEKRPGELRDAIVHYLVKNGLTGLSLRPLAKALGCTPRVLLYHFGSKEKMVIEVLAQVRERQRASYDQVEAPSFGEACLKIWERMSAPDSEPLFRLFFETYGMALRWNDLLFAVRKQLGLPYWSLSAWLKHKVKNAVEYISRFEEAVAAEAANRGVDGVVCGHIHHAEIRQIGGVLYLNDGDWVESCSALVEDARGNLEILRWASPPQRNASPASAEAAVPALIPA